MMFVVPWVAADAASLVCFGFTLCFATFTLICVVLDTRGIDMPASAKRSIVAFFSMWVLMCVLRIVELAIYVVYDLSTLQYGANLGVSVLDTTCTWLLLGLLSMVIASWAMTLFQLSVKLVVSICSVVNVAFGLALAGLVIYATDDTTSIHDMRWRPWQLFVAVWASVYALLFLVFGLALLRLMTASLRRAGFHKDGAKKQLRRLSGMIVVLMMSLSVTASFRCALALDHSWAHEYKWVYSVHLFLAEIVPAVVILSGLRIQLSLKYPPSERGSRLERKRAAALLAAAPSTSVNMSIGGGGGGGEGIEGSSSSKLGKGAEWSWSGGTGGSSSSFSFSTRNSSMQQSLLTSTQG